jgi:hypothetical protein
MREALEKSEIPEEDVIDAIDKFIKDFGFNGLKLLDRKDKEKDKQV